MNMREWTWMTAKALEPWTEEEQPGSQHGKWWSHWMYQSSWGSTCWCLGQNLSLWCPLLPFPTCTYFPILPSQVRIKGMKWSLLVFLSLPYLWLQDIQHFETSSLHNSIRLGMMTRAGQRVRGSDPGVYTASFRGKRSRALLPGWRWSLALLPNHSQAVVLMDFLPDKPEWKRVFWHQNLEEREFTTWHIIKRDGHPHNPILKWKLCLL